MAPIINKTHIKEVKQDAIIVACSCGEDYTHTIKDFDPLELDDLGNYESLATFCPECQEATFFNMSLPPLENDEQELYEAPFFPAGEKEARELVRAVMWQTRKDLKGKDRAKAEKAKKDELEKKYELPFEAIKENAKRVAKNQQS